jgi:hypothetical protein
MTQDPTLKPALTLLLSFTVLFLCGSIAAQTSSSAQKQAPPADSSSALPQDRHDGLSVSAKPYTNPELAKEKFGKANPMAVGILPVEVFLHNETLEALRVDVSTIQLSVTFPNGKHQDLDWLSAKEVASTVAHPNGPPAPQSRRFPVGIGSISDKKTDKMLETIGPLALDADVVPPTATIHGFLFFDLGGKFTLADDASLYVPDVTSVPLKKALMFFEVPLSKSGHGRKGDDSDE